MIEQIVRVLYPPREEWPDEMKARHFNHLKLALTLSQEALNEDIKTILKMAKK